MTTQLLFYESAVPVSLQRHRDWCVQGGNYEFAKKINSVPLMAVEIPHAAREYTVVFSGGETVTPLAVLGINDNVYVTEQGTWKATYIPAFIRRYPFVFSENKQLNNFTLCVDESWNGWNQHGQGEKLFDGKGEQTPYLKNILKFLQDYQVEVQRTRAYCEKLKQLGLLDPMQAEFTLPGGQKQSLRGFLTVNRDKLKDLPAEKLVEAVKTGELEVTYCHLQSINNFKLMLEKFAQAHSANE